MIFTFNQYVIENEIVYLCGINSFFQRIMKVVCSLTQTNRNTWLFFYLCVNGSLKHFDHSFYRMGSPISYLFSQM